MSDCNLSTVHALVWACGDFSGIGHRQHAEVAVIVNLPNEYKLSDLMYRFEAIANKSLGLHMDKWFTDEDDNLLPECDVEILDNLGISHPDGECSVEDFFSIWRQLVPHVFPGACVLSESGTNYIGMTGGYGLWDSKISR